MIDRVAFGSIERFIGILIKHYAGKFPARRLWYRQRYGSFDKTSDYAEKVYRTLKVNHIRTEFDTVLKRSVNNIGEAQMEKVPDTLVLGANRNIYRVCCCGFR